MKHHFLDEAWIVNTWRTRFFLLVWLLAPLGSGWGAPPGEPIPALQITQAATPTLIVQPSGTYSILENQPLTLHLSVENAGNEAFLYSFTPPVENASIDREQGIFRFLPNYIQAATYTFLFTASNWTQQVTQAVTVRVNDYNRPPQVKAGFGETFALKEGTQANLQIVGVDADIDNALIYSVTPELPHFSLDPQTGFIHFAPDHTQAGVYDLIFSVSDGTVIASVTAAITVIDVNRPPSLTLNPTTGGPVWLGLTYNLLALGLDPDGDPLQLSATGLPRNSSFDPNTGLFSFTPVLEQFREKSTVTFTVSDGMYSGSRSIELEVFANFSHLYEFNIENYSEGWTANSWFCDFSVSDGKLKGTPLNGDPFFYHSGYRIDSFSKTKVLVRAKFQSPATIDMYFITALGEHYGPAKAEVSRTGEFVTYRFDVEPYFPNPKVIESIRIDPDSTLNAFEIDWIGIYHSPFPDRTPTPTLAATPTLTPTPTLSPTPIPIWTPTPPPTPTPRVPMRLYDFDKHDAIPDGFIVTTVQGYAPAFVAIEGVTTTPLFAGNALAVQAEPGQGAFLLTRDYFISGEEPVSIQVAVRAPSNRASVALIGLNAPQPGVVDGQVAYNHAMEGALPLGVDETMTLVYRPPDGALHLALQVVNPADATGTITVLMDHLAVQQIDQIWQEARIPLAPDGSFEQDMTLLIPNLNSMDGSVQLVQDADLNRKLQLSVHADQTAANAALWAHPLDESLPALFIAQADVERQFGSESMLGFVLTNGARSVALFTLGKSLPAGISHTIFVGGSISQRNPSQAPILLFQNAGGGHPSSVQIDQITLWKGRLPY
jgi:hypothetical protein